MGKLKTNPIFNKPNLMVDLSLGKINRHYFSLKGLQGENALARLANKTFLSDWIYRNPKLPNGKELCDLLIVFGDIAIIWQIKTTKLDDDGSYREKDLRKNKAQALGAYRHIKHLKTPLTLSNNRNTIIFNGETIKEIYLISAMFGNDDPISFGFAEEEKGKFVHVIAKTDIEIILNELDTISDFVEYFRNKEKLFSRDSKILVDGGERELLGSYLLNNKSFKDYMDLDLVIIQNGFMEEYYKRKEVHEKKKEEAKSYFWDNLIDEVYKTGNKSYEPVAREMAKFNRFERRMISEVYMVGFDKALKEANCDRYGRYLKMENCAIVFIYISPDTPMDVRAAMLGETCRAVQIYYGKKISLGITTGKTLGSSHLHDYCLLTLDEITEEMVVNSKKICAELGIMQNMRYSDFHIDEYPII
jgi:hypothetical protein